MRRRILALVILTSLAETERHGAAIARDVLDQTGGDLRLWPATLYRTLDDMEAAGLIEEVPEAARPARLHLQRRVGPRPASLEHHDPGRAVPSFAS